LAGIGLLDAERTLADCYVSLSSRTAESTVPIESAPCRHFDVDIEHIAIKLVIMDSLAIMALLLDSPATVMAHTALELVQIVLDDTAPSFAGVPSSRDLEHTAHDSASEC